MLNKRFAMGQTVEVLEDGIWKQGTVDASSGERYDVNHRGVVGEPDRVMSYRVMFSDGKLFTATTDDVIR